jgi:hypothetical protein
MVGVHTGCIPKQREIMNRHLPPVAPSPAPKGFTQAREVHPLLSGFPLTVMMLGTLLVLFALTMTLSADADGAAHARTRSSPVVRSVATRPVTTSVF